MVTKKTQGVSSNLFALGHKFSNFVPSTSGARRNFPNFFALDFPQLLYALRKKLKFHLNVEQGFKKLLNGLLDLSFWGVTSIFRSSNTVSLVRFLSLWMEIKIRKVKWICIVLRREFISNRKEIAHVCTYYYQFISPVLRGNIPFSGNVVCILFMSSERLRISQLNPEALIQLLIEIFWTPTLTIWNICTCSNRNFSLQHTTYEFPDMIWSWNLHWGYSLLNEAGQWFYQLVQVTFSKKVFWSSNCTIFLSNFLRWHFNFTTCVEVDISSEKLHIRKYFR